MIKNSNYPRTKQDLIRALHYQRIQQIEVIEPYHTTQDQELLSALRGMANRPGEVSIIILRIQ